MFLGGELNRKRKPLGRDLGLNEERRKNNMNNNNKKKTQETERKKNKQTNQKKPSGKFIFFQEEVSFPA